MADYLIQSETLTNIADAIRSKTGTTGAISVPDMPNQIASIQTGIELPTLTTPADDAEVFEGKEYIKQDGSAGTGTFTLADEISAQETLINTLLSVLDEKAAASAPEMKIAYVYRNSTMTYTVLFPEGATWQDFIDSKYNAYATNWNVVSPMFVTSGDRVAAYNGSDFLVATENSYTGTVKLTDTITDGQIYQFFYVD